MNPRASTAPSPTWFLAEGATGPFFETFVLLANPKRSAGATATVTFLPGDGVPVVKDEDGAGAGAA